jgi:hypothetical protein
MYITQEMACREIAEKTGHSKSVIFRAVTRFGIPTRDNRYYRLKDGRKPYLKNGVHHLKGKPPSEHPNWKGGLTPERQSFYASAEWKESCKAVWHRADARCERCGIHHNEAATRGTFHIHHIITFMVRELRAKVSNLVLLCKKCHKFVHSKQNTYREFIGEKNARA